MKLSKRVILGLFVIACFLVFSCSNNNQEEDYRSFNIYLWNNGIHSSIGELIYEGWYLEHEDGLPLPNQQFIKTIWFNNEPLHKFTRTTEEELYDQWTVIYPLPELTSGEIYKFIVETNVTKVELEVIIPHCITESNFPEEYDYTEPFTLTWTAEFDSATDSVYREVRFAGCNIDNPSYTCHTDYDTYVSKLNVRSYILEPVNTSESHHVSEIFLRLNRYDFAEKNNISIHVYPKSMMNYITTYYY